MEETTNSQPQFTPNRGQTYVRRQPINDFSNHRPSRRLEPTPQAAPAPQNMQQGTPIPGLPSKPEQPTRPQAPNPPDFAVSDPVNDIASPLFQNQPMQSQVQQTTYSQNFGQQTQQTTPAQPEAKAAVKKSPMPLGIYLIIGFSFIAIIINFLRSSSFGDITSLLIILQSIAALMLFLRKNFIRIALIVISTVIVIASLALMAVTFIDHQRINTLEAQYNQAVSKLPIPNSTVGPEQSSTSNELANNQSDISNLRHQSGKNLSYAIAGQSIALLYSIAVMWYLSQAKIKKVF